MRHDKAWRALEARFASALTAWGFTPTEQDAEPYARSIVRNLRAEGWRTPLPPGHPAPAHPAWDRRAEPAAVTAYAQQARAEIRRQRERVGT